jgi:hypothetical protein
MMQNARNLLALSVLLIPALLLSGCAGGVKHMQAVPPERAVEVPSPGRSMVVFMRPSGMAFGIQSSVFEVTDDRPRLAGILAAKKKVSYELEPGERLFMVIGESADFMSADLLPDKTYCALVTPRMGVWKSRFSLKPVHAGELQSQQFNEWLAGCAWVEKTPESEQWAEAHMPSIQSKQQGYYEKWMRRPESDRPRLFPQDGR